MTEYMQIQQSPFLVGLIAHMYSFSVENLVESS